MKHGKKYIAIVEKKDKTKTYELVEAISFLKENVNYNFDNSVEIHMNLGVDPKHADQMVRGNVILPHGTGKEVKVLVFATGDLAAQAKEAGADYVGEDDLVAKIQGGWLDFDKAVATPDMMKIVGKVARVLGPRGMMPNPKTGTVTKDVDKVIKELKAGKVSYRVDKGSNIHAAVGKLSFSPEQIKENAESLISSVIKARPASARGEYIKSLFIATSMSPSIKINKSTVR